MMLEYRAGCSSRGILAFEALFLTYKEVSLASVSLLIFFLLAADSGDVMLVKIFDDMVL